MLSGRDSEHVMNVAFFVPKFPVVSQTFILNQITGLIDRGHEVAIFSEARPDDEPVHAEVREYRLLERVVYLDAAGGARPRDLIGLAGLAVHAPRALGMLRPDRAALFGGRVPLLQRFSRLRSSGVRPDIVHCHFGTTAQRSLFARALWPVPFVASFYGADCSRHRFTRQPGYYDALFGHADCVTGLSQHMEERLRSLGCPADRVGQHRIGVDPQQLPFRAREAPEDGRVRLLTVARLVEKKGVEFALRGIAQLPPDVRASLHYDIVAGGELRAELEALSGSLGLSAQVTFHGDADSAFVRRTLSDADLFILPSVTAEDGDQEGTPTVLMEASACGLPVVSTDHAGIPDVIPDGVTGVLVPERDPAAIARAVADLIGAPGRWAEMGRAGREHIERSYNIRTLNVQLEELYEQVGADRARRGR
jgi:colanic acid/amylovoran biosynthesis glycosyltransferase